MPTASFETAPSDDGGRDGAAGDELVRLEVSDIDSERMMVKVEQGKGKKDRYTIVETAALRAARVSERASLAEVPSPNVKAI